jgi:hypothetical protein
MKRKRAGQPKSDGTVRILKDGTARLAENLAKVGDKFKVEFKGSKVYLQKYDYSVSGHISRRFPNKYVMAYASNSGAASPLISLMGTLTAMGFPGEVQENLAGEYKVKIIDDGIIEFDLNCEIKK